MRPRSRIAVWSVIVPLLTLLVGFALRGAITPSAPQPAVTPVVVTQIVERQVPVTQIVERQVTQIVEKQSTVVVTQVVQQLVVVTATPVPITATQVSVAPTAAPPTATPVPKSGKVLYQANWTSGAGGWAPAFGWKPLNGMLLNDGSNAESSHWQSNWLAAPFEPGEVSNYAVEAEIQLVRRPSCGSFGIVARGGYEAGIVTCGNPTIGLRVKSGNPLIEDKSYSPDADWHTLRMDLVGNAITVLVDGAVYVRATDNVYLSPGQVGLWSDRTQVSVRSFKVIALQ